MFRPKTLLYIEETPLGYVSRFAMISLCLRLACVYLSDIVDIFDVWTHNVMSVSVTASLSIRYSVCISSNQVRSRSVGATWRIITSDRDQSWKITIMYFTLIAH